MILIFGYSSRTKQASFSPSMAPGILISVNRTSTSGFVSRMAVLRQRFPPQGHGTLCLRYGVRCQRRSQKDLGKFLLSPSLSAAETSRAFSRNLSPNVSQSTRRRTYGLRTLAAITLCHPQCSTAIRKSEPERTMDAKQTAEKAPTKTRGAFPRSYEPYPNRCRYSPCRRAGGSDLTVITSGE